MVPAGRGAAHCSASEAELGKLVDVLPLEPLSPPPPPQLASNAAHKAMPAVENAVRVNAPGMRNGVMGVGSWVCASTSSSGRIAWSRSLPKRALHSGRRT